MLDFLLQLNVTAYSSYSSIPKNELVPLIAIIVVFIAIRIYKGFNGIKFGKKTVYRTPILYLIIVLLGLAALNPSYLDVVISLAAIILGIIIGINVSAGVTFFEKDSISYYKRSPIIMIVWLISFLLRLIIEVVLPSSMIIATIIELILSLTTGLIIGEALHIVKRYEHYKSKGINLKTKHT